MLGRMPPTGNTFISTKIRRAVLAALAVMSLLAGCGKPPSSAAPQGQAPAPFSSPQAGAAKEVKEVELSEAVIRILASAHRSGTLIYRGSCTVERRITERYRLREPVKLEPMADALEEISRRYPDLKWRETGESGVRVLDTSVAGGLLKVRLKEFTVIEDREPEAALAALWRTPEVINYMASHDVRFAHQEASPRARRKRAVVVVRVKDATVEEIVQRIVAGYPAAEGNGGGRRFWLYRECSSGAETVVEVKVL